MTTLINEIENPIFSSFGKPEWAADFLAIYAQRYFHKSPYFIMTSINEGEVWTVAPQCRQR